METKQGRFSEQETKEILKYVNEYLKSNNLSAEDLCACLRDDNSSNKLSLWKELYALFPNRKPKAIYQHTIRKYMGMKRRSWTEEEKAELLSLEQENPSNWSYIGKMLGRTAEDCKTTHRNLSIRRNMGSYSKEEEASLLSSIGKYVDLLNSKDLIFSGIPWSYVARDLGNKRTPLDYLRHWEVLRRKILVSAVTLSSQSSSKGNPSIIIEVVPQPLDISDIEEVAHPSNEDDAVNDLEATPMVLKDQNKSTKSRRSSVVQISVDKNIKSLVKERQGVSLETSFNDVEDRPTSDLEVLNESSSTKKKKSKRRDTLLMESDESFGSSSNNISQVEENESQKTPKKKRRHEHNNNNNDNDNDDGTSESADGLSKKKEKKTKMKENIIVQFDATMGKPKRFGSMSDEELLNYLEESGAVHESEISWSDIDRQFLNTVAFASQRWKMMSKLCPLSMKYLPEKVAFLKKLKFSEASQSY